MFYTVPTSKEEIDASLNSSVTRDVSLGLEALLTMVADGKDVHSYFGNVVKSVNSSDLRVREMCACLLLMYSQHEPEATLLMVNAVKLMLGNASPVVRMQALHLVSALRIPTIAPIITHFISDTSNDLSPLVRIACCQAIGKCYELDSSLSADALEMLQKILSSPKQQESYRVAGWALATLAVHWPQRLDVLHPFYRLYLPHLAEFDEFCIVQVVKMVVRYARRYLTGPSDPDAQLFISSVKPLLSSKCLDVVCEAAAAIHYVGGDLIDPKLIDSVALRLFSLDRNPLVFSCMLSLSIDRPKMFSAYASDIIFDLSPTDSPDLRVFALELLALANHQLDAKERSHLKWLVQCWQSDPRSVSAVLRLIYENDVVNTNAVSPSTYKWLIKLAASNESPVLASEALSALLMLVQQPGSNTLGLLAKLAESRGSMSVDSRARLMWVLGTCSSSQPALSSEILRQVLPGMANEPPLVRLQILQLAAKLYTAYRNDSGPFDARVPSFFEFALKVARFDSDIDVRDRARLFASLMEREDNAMASLLLQTTLPEPQQVKLEPQLVNSTSAYFGKDSSLVEIGNWSSEDTSVLREVSINAFGDDSSDSSSSTPTPTTTTHSVDNPSKNVSLEDFLSEN